MSCVLADVWREFDICGLLGSGQGSSRLAGGIALASSSERLEERVGRGGTAQIGTS
jgi:hypothetical protein